MSGGYHIAACSKLAIQADRITGTVPTHHVTLFGYQNPNTWADDPHPEGGGGA